MLGTGGYVVTHLDKADGNSLILIHPHTAQVVPACDLIEENEKRGAGDFHVSWEVEVAMSFGLSSAQASLKCHLDICINSSMQACVYMVWFLHLCPIWFFKHQD